jgi:nitrite reductase (NO-forming)
MGSARSVGLVLAAVAVVALALGFGGGVAGVAQDASPMASPLGSPAASPVASPAAGGAGVTIVGVDIAWEYNGQRSAPNQPVRVEVAPGTVVSLPNNGAAAHNFVIEQLGVLVDMPVGGTATYTVPADLPPGEYEFICNLPGHEPAGMIGVLVVG